MERQGIVKPHAAAVSVDTFVSAVAISYAHGILDAQVVALADRLNREGVDCEIDVYDDAPAQGWNRWMTEMMISRTILVAVSEAYYRRFHLREQAGVGTGATYESGLLLQRIVESQGSNRTVIPILFDENDRQFIPEPLRDVTRYLLPNDYDRLYRRLTGQPAYRKPSLGEVRRLDAVARETPHTLHTVASDAGRRNDILLIQADSDAFTLPFRELERGNAFRAILVTQPGTREAASIARLREYRNTIGIAWGLEGVAARIRGYREVYSDGEQRVELELAEDANRSTFGSEVAVGSASADDIAQMRARRILLDERLPRAEGNDWSVAGLNRGTLDSFISGGSMLSSGPQIASSPLPPLADRIRNNPGEWLVFARLLCVLLLRRTNTVERILRLDLDLVSPNQIHVEFAGIRARIYENVDAPEITISGDCRLP